MKNIFTLDRDQKLPPGHDDESRRGAGLGHDREDKNGRALGHVEKTSVEDCTATKCGSDPILAVGTAADELIAGKCANDELYGDAGDDLLYGGGGADYLAGNWGSDTLIGGAGADTFCFDGDFDRDLVVDFSVRDGDRLTFILYGQDKADWTADDLLEMCDQQGDDAVFALPDGDETAILAGVDVADLHADMISVIVIDAGTAVFV